MTTVSSFGTKMDIDDVTAMSTVPRPALTVAGLPMPGQVWKMKDSRRLIEVVAFISLPPLEAYVRAWELEGPARSRTKRCFRAVRVSRLDVRVPKEEK